MQKLAKFEVARCLLLRRIITNFAIIACACAHTHNNKVRGMKQQNHIIGFDAKIANSTPEGRGFYGRFIIDAVATACPKRGYFRMYVPKRMPNSAYDKLELKHNVERTANYLQSAAGGTIEKELAFFKLESKFTFLISDKPSKYRLWSEWYPEANKYILENRNVSTRSRWLQWAAWKGQWWIVWLHYQLVIRVVYGIIYR